MSPFELLGLGFVLGWLCRRWFGSWRSRRGEKLRAESLGARFEGWRFVCSGACETGWCDCREFAGLLIGPGVTIPPRHDGCSCYLVEP